MGAGMPTSCDPITYGVAVSRAAGVVKENLAEAYGQRAYEYTALFGDAAPATAGDREEIAQWADGVDGLILDVGCGPGQWAVHLAERGCQVRGLDPVAAFVDIARWRHGGSRRCGVRRRRVRGPFGWELRRYPRLVLAHPRRTRGRAGAAGAAVESLIVV